MYNLDYYVDLATSGDRQAFEELYRQTYYVVYYTCFNLLKNEQDAQDVTQDVYVTVMNTLQTLEDKGKFMPWLNRIAVNKCKDFLKKNRTVSVDVENMENAPLEENESFLPEEYAINQAKRQVVLNIMRSTLSEKEYQTVFLYYFNGLTIPEIADVMECPVGTVTYRLSAARGKIKQGVLAYENKTDDKLYSFAAVPFLASVFVSEVNELYGIGMLPQGVYAAVSASAGTNVSAGQAGNAIKNNIGRIGMNTMKKKIIAGIVAAVLVGGGATAMILHNKDKDKDDSDKTTTELADERTEEEDRYDNTSENTTENTTEETTTEEVTEAQPDEIQSLELIKLKEYTENRDGQDVISGHIKDIIYEEGSNCALIILADDGHLYSYYNDGAGYYISDLGQPSWDITDIDTYSSDMERENGEVTIFEGNHYYHVEVEDCKAVKIIDSVMLEGKDIREIGISKSYGGSFYIYCEDGSYYYVHTNKNDDTEGPFLDTGKYLIDYTGALINIVPEGLEMVDRSGEFALCSDGKLYLHKSGSSAMEVTPIENTADYTFTKLYDPYSVYQLTAAVTDTNELMILQDEKAEIVYTIALPESEILDLWYNKGMLIVKTADGYYSCTPDEDPTLKPDDLFNSLTEDVVDIYGRYVLLSDGFVYEFPYGY
ncbi:MAG: RNA polymerase sigma factor [Wujia sp.]